MSLERNCEDCGVPLQEGKRGFRIGVCSDCYEIVVWRKFFTDGGRIEDIPSDVQRIIRRDLVTEAKFKARLWKVRSALKGAYKQMNVIEVLAEKLLSDIGSVK